MRVLAVKKIPLSLVDPPRRPHRSAMDEAKLRETAESMSLVGQLAPVRVIEADGRFEIVYGHRRLIAARRLGWTELNAEIVEATDREVILARAHENAKREELSPLDRAIEAKLVLDACEGDIEAAAMSLGYSVPTVDALLEILDWPRDIQEAVDSRQIGRGAGRWLAKIGDVGERDLALRTALRDGCTEALGRWYYQQWALKGTVAADSGGPRRDLETGVPLRDPTWPCYLCLEDLSFGSLYTVRVCAKCAPQIAANRPEGKSNDPNIGLLG